MIAKLKTKLALVSYITLIDNLIIFETLANVNNILKVGDRLYKKYVELRDKAGVTDYEVAKQTGVSTSTLTNWKYGRYEPKLSKLYNIAKYFGVTVDYFLDDTTQAQ